MPRNPAAASRRTAAPTVPAAAIESVRRFNRYYTQTIGVLQEGLLRSPYSLTEVRVMYELAHRDAPTARDLAHDLGLDPGYLSRMLKRFVEQGLVLRRPSAQDARAQLLRLSPKGRRAFAPLDRAAASEVQRLLAPLAPAAQAQLLDAMHAIERALAAPAPERSAPVLRGPQPGDLGWVVQRHGELYAREYRYDQRFEALVAQIVGDFGASCDPQRERCWIAEVDGRRAGSIFLVRSTQRVAKLRLLLVEPSARGLGVGARLVAACVDFARRAGYRKIVLWTQSELHAARRLYEAAGFRRTGEEAHASWSRDDLVAETWELAL